MSTDFGYDTRGFGKGCRKSQVMPRAAHKRHSVIGRRNTRLDGNRFRQRARKRIEDVICWVNIVGGGRKLRYYGVERNRFWMEMTTTSYNLVRLSKLTPVSA